MKMRNLARGMCLCVVLLTACTSVPSRFYQLQASSMPGQNQQPGAVLLVEQVTCLPEWIDRSCCWRTQKAARSCRAGLLDSQPEPPADPGVAATCPRSWACPPCMQHRN
jgi:hypothetical protein